MWTGWLFSFCDNDGKNIWRCQPFVVSASSFLAYTVVLFCFFLQNRRLQYLSYKQGRNWTNYIRAQIVYMISFWNPIVALWTILWEEYFDGTMIFNWINLYPLLEWNKREKTFCHISDEMFKRKINAFFFFIKYF